MAETIPGPLLDRMEVIRLDGYTEDEKVNIATKYLLPKQMKNNGVKKDELEISEAAVRDIVRYYTREAGVRALERELSKICRKVVKTALLRKGEKEEAKTRVMPRNLDKFLGVRRYSFGMADKEAQIGQVTGLAWTEVGGEILVTETTLMPGKGRLTLTGKLGDVMQESAQAAMSYVRSRAEEFGIPRDFHRHSDVHIHVPEGAIPKDGPSAGITMATALVSALTRVPTRRDVAMTGEITLRGKVLPIGGVKEKVLAAHRAGLRTIIMPKENEKDLADIPKPVLDVLEVHLAETMDDVLKVALAEPLPPPLPPQDATRAAAVVDDLDDRTTH